MAEGSLAESSLPLCATLVNGPVVARGRMPAPNRRSEAGVGSTGSVLACSGPAAESSLGLPSSAVGGVFGSLPCAGGSPVVERPNSFASSWLLKCELASGARFVAVSDANTLVDRVEAAGPVLVRLGWLWVWAGASCFEPASLPLPDVSFVLYESVVLIMTHGCSCQATAAAG